MTATEQYRSDWADYGKLTGLSDLRDYVEATGRPFRVQIVGVTNILGRQIVQANFPDVRAAMAWIDSCDNTGFEYLNDPKLYTDLAHPLNRIGDPVTLTVQAGFRPRM